MATIKVDEETKNTLNQLAREEQRPEDELLRVLVANYRLNRTLDDMQELGRPIAKRLGIKTDDDIERIFG